MVAWRLVVGFCRGSNSVFLELDIRYKRHFVGIAQVVDLLHNLFIVQKNLVSLEVLSHKLLVLRCHRKLLHCFGHLVVPSRRQLIDVVLGLKVLVLAHSDPRRFGHWSVDLFEVEFALDDFFVDVRDHVWWLDEWHRERWPHQDIEPVFLLFREVEHDGLKLLANSTLHLEGLDQNLPKLVLLDCFEVFKIDCKVLVVLVGHADLVVDHGLDQVQLLQVAGVLRGDGWCGEQIAYLLESLLPLLLLD